MKIPRSMSRVCSTGGMGVERRQQMGMAMGRGKTVGNARRSDGDDRDDKKTLQEKYEKN